MSPVNPGQISTRSKPLARWEANQSETRKARHRSALLLNHRVARILDLGQIGDVDLVSELLGRSGASDEAHALAGLGTPVRPAHGEDVDRRAPSDVKYRMCPARFAAESEVGSRGEVGRGEVLDPAFQGAALEVRKQLKEPFEGGQDLRE